MNFSQSFTTKYPLAGAESYGKPCLVRAIRAFLEVILKPCKVESLN